MSKILIIEDEQLLREAFEFLLKAEGHDVEVAKNGKIGIAKLNAFQPDLVLLDMLMPIMNGVEFLEQANLRKTHPKTKVVVLSNLSDTITVDEAPRYNVKETLIKANLSPVELVGIVQKHLKKPTRGRK